MKCFIIGCKNIRSKRVSLHRVIRKGKIKEDWIDAIEHLNGQKLDSSTVLTSSLICENHFEPEYIKNYGHKKWLTDDAVPTIFEKQIENVEIIDVDTDSQLEENYSGAGASRESPQLVQSRKRPFNVQDATSTSLEKRYKRLEQLFEKNKNALKEARRTITRKDKQIKSLTSIIKDLENKK